MTCTDKTAVIMLELHTWSLSHIDWCTFLHTSIGIRYTTLSPQPEFAYRVFRQLEERLRALLSIAWTSIDTTAVSPFIISITGRTCNAQNKWLQQYSSSIYSIDINSSASSNIGFDDPGSFSISRFAAEAGQLTPILLCRAELSWEFHA